MATMTFNLSDTEMEVLSALAKEQELTKTQMLKQALRFYQLVLQRARNGETISFSGDPGRIVEFVGPGFWTIHQPQVPE